MLSACYHVGTEYKRSVNYVSATALDCRDGAHAHTQDLPRGIAKLQRESARAITMCANHTVIRWKTLGRRRIVRGIPGRRQLEREKIDTVKFSQKVLCLPTIRRTIGRLPSVFQGFAVQNGRAVLMPGNTAIVRAENTTFQRARVRLGKRAVACVRLCALGRVHACSRARGRARMLARMNSAIACRHMFAIYAKYFHSIGAMNSRFSQHASAAITCEC